MSLKSAWNAWEKGNAEFEKGNGENLDLLIEATDYLDNAGESGIMSDFAEETDIDNTKESDIIKESIPYMNSRPTYTDGQVEAVWEAWKSADGKVYDPSGQEIIWDRTKPRKGQWDMGHIPGQKYAEVHAKYIGGKMTKEEFLAWYRNPANYRPELPKTNRSHKYE